MLGIIRSIIKSIMRRLAIRYIFIGFFVVLGGFIIISNNIYDATRNKAPSISDNITYSITDDFILVGCEVKYTDSLDHVKVYYNDQVVKMDYATRPDAQGKKRDRYTAKLPKDADNYEITIIATDKQGDTDTYIVEK